MYVAFWYRVRVQVQVKVKIGVGSNENHLMDDKDGQSERLNDSDSLQVGG